MKIAAAAFPVEWHDRWNDYVGKLRVWVRTAAENGAEVLVFPEYGGLELASLAGEEIARDLPKAIDAVTARIKDADELHASLAREFRVHICAGSAPLRLDDGRAVNRARMFGPDGSHGAQDKLIMTRFEREEFGISPGSGVRVFETSVGTLAVVVCYDAEFPLIVRAAVAAGADVVLVPSSTEAMQGYWRVRVASMARALENQCAVAQAVAIGDAGWCPAVDRNVGAAGIYGPPDKGFPEDGLIALGKMNSAGWVYGEVSHASIREVRTEGVVLNHAHWDEQLDGRLDPVETVTLAAPE